MHYASKKVLIVDDSRFVRAVMQQKFKNHGYAVITASDGEEGLAMAKMEMPDAIVIDWYMPKLTGLALIEKLKAIPAMASIPVFVVSGTATQDTKESALKSGASGFMTKSNTVTDEIVSVLDHSQLAA